MGTGNCTQCGRGTEEPETMRRPLDLRGGVLKLVLIQSIFLVDFTGVGGEWFFPCYTGSTHVADTAPGALHKL